MNIEGMTSYVSALLLDYGMKIVGAVIIFFIGSVLIGKIREIVRRKMRARNVDVTLRRFTVSAISTVLWILVVLAVLAKFGVEIAPMIAGLGVAGFAIGFAVQGSLSNFASGIMLIILKPFKLDDLIEAGGELGVVKEIGLMTCVLATLDNQKVIIPNAKLFGDTIKNITGYDTRRVDMSIGISYDSDITAAQEIITSTLLEHPDVLKERGTTVEVVELADSSVNFTVRAWCKTENYWNVFFGCNKNIKYALDKAGIEIPFPQMTVWTKN